MADNYYGKGIKVASGFDLGAMSPLDSRIVVNTIAERNAHVTNNRVYEGMMVYVIEEQTNYQYINSTWVELKAGSNGGGNANIHIGTEPPQNTTYMWIDTSVPFNLDVSTYEGRLRIKYIEMLNQVIEKINSLSEKINKIEENINKISSDNSVKINESKTQLSLIKARITSLLSRVNETQFQLMNGGDLPVLKSAAKQLRKEMKQDILYSLADLNYNVMVILDSEVQFIQPDNPSTPNDPSINVGDSTLLTEDGFMLLTEDGLVILIDGGTSSDNIKNAILTELGQVILTEDGSIILIDGGTSSDGSSDILQGAILTEQGKVLLLENGKQLLKG